MGLVLSIHPASVQNRVGLAVQNGLGAPKLKDPDIRVLTMSASYIDIRLLRAAATPLWLGRLLGGSAPWRGARDR
jgi:hypothetical protein